jgi:2-polyprenyl-6-methoxyphenol hydroxylase-like FAD-dependent oxidoreductase
MRVIINGAGIAGPTLAYWLRKAGHDVVLVEAASQLRTGGYVIDFGLVGYDIAEKMGLIPWLRELGYQVRELRFVDREGRTSARGRNLREGQKPVVGRSRGQVFRHWCWTARRPGHLLFTPGVARYDCRCRQLACRLLARRCRRSPAC